MRFPGINLASRLLPFAKSLWRSLSFAAIFSTALRAAFRTEARESWMHWGRKARRLDPIWNHIFSKQLSNFTIENWQSTQLVPVDWLQATGVLQGWLSCLLRRLQTWKVLDSFIQRHKAHQWLSVRLSLQTHARRSCVPQCSNPSISSAYENDLPTHRGWCDPIQWYSTQTAIAFCWNARCVVVKDCSSLACVVPLYLPASSTYPPTLPSFENGGPSHRL